MKHDKWKHQIKGNNAVQAINYLFLGGRCRLTCVVKVMFYRRKYKMENTNLRLYIRILEGVAVVSAPASASASAIWLCQPFWTLIFHNCIHYCMPSAAARHLSLRWRHTAPGARFPRGLRGRWKLTDDPSRVLLTFYASVIPAGNSISSLTTKSYIYITLQSN